MLRLSLPFLLVPLAAGCGGRSFSAADLAKGREALAAALDAWQKGERAEGLLKRPEPIQFSEEWIGQGVRLLSYEIVGSRHTDRGLMRFTVKLEVQTPRGRRESREVTFGVALKSPVVVTRDPFF